MKVLNKLFAAAALMCIFIVPAENASIWSYVAWIVVFFSSVIGLGVTTYAIEKKKKEDDERTWIS